MRDSISTVKTLEARLINRLSRSYNEIVLQSSRKKTCQALSKILPNPIKVLDIPNYTADFYPNVMTWCPVTGLLAVALYNTCYLWNPHSNKTFLLSETRDGSYFSCLSFSPSGMQIILATSYGSLLSYKLNQSDFQFMSQLPLHPSLVTYGSDQFDMDRICGACWTSKNIILVGNRKGNLMFVEVGDGLKLLKTIQEAHSQEICAIYKQNAITPYSAMYGAMIATGGNDNCVRCWDERFMHGQSPLLHLNHGAAVKGVKFSTNSQLPSKFLITGSGSRDQKIRIWDVRYGTLSASFQTGNQICDLLVINDSNPPLLVVAHGYSSPHIATYHIIGENNTFNSLKIIPAEAYPSTASSKSVNRILQLAQYKNFLASAATDEYLKIWQVDKESPRSVIKRLSLIR